MPEIDNAALADRLETLAALLDLAGASPYSVRAYRRAAELIRVTPVPVADLVRQGRVRELRGIGGSIEARLLELVETGRLAEIDELESELQPELVALGRLVGLAPQRMVELGRALGVSSADELREAAAAGRVREVPGFGPQTEAKVRAALERPRATPRSGLTLNRAWELVGGMAETLGGVVAGDPRRWCAVSYRLAVVVPGDDVGAIVAHFRSLPQVVSLVERSEHGALGLTPDGVPVELVVAGRTRFGTELVRATGSDAYVAALGDLPDAEEEEDVYRELGLPWLPPELREEPFRGVPPELVELDEIRGDLHVHTTWSDGKASVLEMAQGAAALGYEYVAICDHTRNVRVVAGLDADDVRRQGEEIAAVNAEVAPLHVLRGTECDILADGALDLPTRSSPSWTGCRRPSTRASASRASN